jgi:hypothetical protein
MPLSSPDTASVQPSAYWLATINRFEKGQTKADGTKVTMEEMMRAQDMFPYAQAREDALSGVTQVSVALGS